MNSFPIKYANSPNNQKGKLPHPIAIAIAGSRLSRRALLIFALFFLCITAAGYLFYRHQEDHITRAKYETLAAVARLKVKSLQEWMQKCLQDGNRLAVNPLMGGAASEISSGQLSPAVKANILSILMLPHTRGSYIYAALTNPDGKIVVTTGNPNFELSGKAKNAIKQAMMDSSSMLTDIYMCSESGRLQLDVVVPILDDIDRPVGAVVLGIDPQHYLYPMIQEWPESSPFAETLLVRRDAHSVLYLNELRHQAGTALALRLPLSNSDLPAAKAVLGYEGTFRGKDYRGVDVLADIRPVPGFPWFLVTKVDASEALEELRFRAIVSGSFVMLLTLLAGMGIVVTFRSRETELLRALYEVERREKEEFAHYRAVLYSIGDAVIMVSLKGEVEGMNPEAERLTGWAERDALGRPLDEVFRIVNEETRAPVESPVARVLAEGVVVGLANHTLLLSRDGVERPIADSAAPVSVDGGPVIGVVLVFRDRTAEREAQQALVAAKERAELYFETAGVAMLVLDMDGRVMSINQRGCSLLGLPREEIVGREWFDTFLSPEMQSKMRAFFDRTAAGEPDTRYMENQVLCGDGRERLVAWTNVLIRDERGEVVGVLSSGEDITERKRAMDELLRTQARLQALATILQYPAENVQELLEVAIEQAVSLTNSQIGHLFRYDDERGEFTLAVRSQSAQDACSIPEPLRSQRQGVRVSTFMREAILQRKAVIVNDYSAPHPLKRGYPQGHPEIQRYMVVPVLRGGNVVAAVGLANKGAEYGKRDVEQIALLMEAVWAAVERLQAYKEKECLALQLAQLQKMESVGMLAGGVAHDFNNMLNVIIGHAELALGVVEDDHPARISLDEILKAAERSADLTSKLLAFARKQTISPRLLNLSQQIDGMKSILRRLIREEIHFDWALQPDLWPVCIDPSQLEQILVNLVVNARDAIAGKGTITIETANMAIDGVYCAEHVEFLPGEYVLLSVSDNGEGIPREVIPQIFEPFFTTKPKGKGTGLGLATVYGIVKQNKGFINVYSEVGKGSTFKIYLPRSRDDGAVEQGRGAEIDLASGTETILVVEDEESILQLIGKVLKQQGYRVLLASLPEEAVTLACAYEGEIHLLITDVVMPEMNGQQLRERLEAARPGIKTLFMSGYTANAIARAGVLDEEVHFIQKPFSVRVLLSTVRSMLGKWEAPGES